MLVDFGKLSSIYITVSWVYQFYQHAGVKMSQFEQYSEQHT